MRELQRYQAEYCALCKAIGEHGFLARNALNYDCAFLALLLDSFREETPLRKERCAFNPLKRKWVVAQSAALAYAADINILLAYHKLDDDWRDGRSVKALLGRAFLAGAAKKAAKRSPEAAAQIRRQILLLSRLEEEKCAQIDLVADAFGALLRLVFELAVPAGSQRKLMGHMGYHLGRWIYLIDAYEDREKDQKSGDYNAFILRYTNSQEAADGARFLLYSAMREATDAFELLEFASNRPLIENILYGGCCEQTEQVLEWKKHRERADGPV